MKTPRRIIFVRSSGEHLVKRFTDAVDIETYVHENWERLIDISPGIARCLEAKSCDKNTVNAVLWANRLRRSGSLDNPLFSATRRRINSVGFWKVPAQLTHLLQRIPDYTYCQSPIKDNRMYKIDGINFLGSMEPFEFVGRLITGADPVN